MSDLLVLNRLRWLGFFEGGSFLVLVGVAMPLKYMAGWPWAVKVVGMAHGVLFLGYVAAVIYVSCRLRWSLGRAFILLVAAFLPFGPFYVDRKILRSLR